MPEITTFSMSAVQTYVVFVAVAAKSSGSDDNRIKQHTRWWQKTQPVCWKSNMGKYVVLISIKILIV